MNHKLNWKPIWMPGLILFFGLFFWNRPTAIIVKPVAIQDHFGNQSEVFLKNYLADLTQKNTGLDFQQTKVSDGLLGERNTQLYDFQQYLDGVPVVGGELRIKEKNGFVFAALGKAFAMETSTKSDFPIYSEKKLKQVIAQKIASNNFTIDEVASNYLVQNSHLVPAVKMVVTTAEGEKKVYQYSGNNLEDMGAPAACSEHQEEAVTCTYRPGCTEYHGNVANYYHQSVVKSEGGLYKLIDDCERNIVTSYWDGGTNYGENPSTNWCNDLRYKRAYSAHWATRFAWDFYRDVMGRNGQFGDGRLVQINLNRCIPAITCNTAWSDPGDFSINLGSGGLSYNQVKNLGHEYSHGVIWSSHWNPGWTNLPTSMWNSTEVRSITEGICNIMGSETENFLYEISASAPNSTIPTAIDQKYEYWKLFDGSQSGESNYSRSLYYEGTNWNYNGSGWNGNTVYDRSFVLCHLFYLLAEGATNYKNPHHPAGSSAPTINMTKLNGSLSRRDASKLMYVSIMSYIHSDWTYEEMAWAMLTTASEWWGICSEQAKRVNTALWAVGLAQSATKVVVDFNQGYFDRPVILRTPNNVQIDQLTSVSDVFIEAGKTIIENHIVQSYYGAKITIKSRTCLPGSGVPGPTLNATYDEIQARTEEEEPDGPAGATSVSVSPNPFSDRIIIDLQEFDSPENIGLRLFNTQGLLLYENWYDYHNTIIEIDQNEIPEMPSGNYYLEVQSKDFREVIKLIKL